MSQQINLLKVEQQALDPLTIALLVWGLAIFGIAVGFGINQMRVAEATRNVAASDMSVKQAKATYDQRVKETGADIAAKIDTIKDKAGRAQQLLAMADALGSATGYASHFSLLASVAAEGVWLDTMTVSGSGRKMQLSGRTLDNDAVLQYSQRLNAVFAEKRVSWTELELTAQPSAAVIGGRPSVASSKFTLR